MRNLYTHYDLKVSQFIVSLFSISEFSETMRYIKTNKLGGHLFQENDRVIVTFLCNCIARKESFC